MRSCLAFFVILVFGVVSPAFPPEDLPSTAYNESDTQPYELNLPDSSVIAETASASQKLLHETESARAALPLQEAIPFAVAAKRSLRSNSSRFTGARTLLAQVCTLLF
jgi:hypothetical protein